MLSQTHPLVKEIKSCCQYESARRPSAQSVAQNLFKLWQTEKEKNQKELKKETSTTTQIKPKEPVSIPEKLITLDKIFHISTVHLLSSKVKIPNDQKTPVSGIKLDEGATSIDLAQVASLPSSMGFRHGNGNFKS